MIKRLVTVFIFPCIFAMGCKQENEEPVPELPVITTSSLELIDGSGSPISKVDTLRLTFEFSDGDFDYGLNPEETLPPYHTLNFFLSNNSQTPALIPGELMLPGNSPPFFLLQPPALESGTIVTFGKLKKQNGSQEYACEKFTDRYQRIGVKITDRDRVYNAASIIDTITSGLGQILILSDSFLIERNRNSRNLIVEYLVEQPDGSFEMFDWSKQFCQEGFNARVPLLGKQLVKWGPFKTQMLSDQRARVTYNMASIGFRILFGGKRLKIRFSIIDRSLNESGVVETDPILVPTP
jgi:hypothetical protein